MSVMPLGAPYQWRPDLQQWTAPGRTPIDASAGFVLGVTEPTRSNTGVGIDGNPTPVTVLNGVTVNAGQTLRDCVVNGWVNLQVGGSIINCVIRGGSAPTDGRPLVNVVVPAGWNGTDQAIIDHCLIQPTPGTRSLGYSAGVGIKAFRCTRTTILDCIDGFTVSGGTTAPRVNIEGCYVSDMVALNPDPWGYWPATHNDCVQFHGSQSAYPTSSASIVGNSFDCRPSAGSNVTTANIVNGSSQVSFADVMVSKPTGSNIMMKLDRNWFRGGNQSLNAVATAVTVVIDATGNRWEQGTADGGTPPDGLPYVAAYVSSASGYTLNWAADNVWISGGQASPKRANL